MIQLLSGKLIGEADIGRAQNPLEIIAGILPFVLIGLMFTLLGIDYGRPLTRIGNNMLAYLAT